MLCRQVELQPFVDHNTVLGLLLVFVIKIIVPDGIGRTLCLLTQLFPFSITLNGLVTEKPINNYPKT